MSAVDTRKGTVTVVDPWGTPSFLPITMPLAGVDASSRRVRVSVVRP